VIPSYLHQGMVAGPPPLFRRIRVQAIDST